jgi:hypothetical protein
LLLLAAMMVYTTWSTHRMVRAELDRAEVLYDQVSELQQRVGIQWDMDRTDFGQQVQALQEEARGRLRGDIDEVRRALVDTLEAQAALAQRLRRSLEHVTRLAQDTKAASDRLAASISEERSLSRQVRDAAQGLQEGLAVRRQTAATLSRVVSENQTELSLASQLQFLLIADALLHPEVVPQLKFDIGYRWYLLRDFDAAAPYFELARTRKDQLAEFARNNVDRLLRACGDEADRAQGAEP